jgi:capsular exopolysaccharide synthesis family protein
VEQGSEAISLEQAIQILRRRAPLIVLCVVAVGGAAFAFSKHEKRKYTATAALSFSYNPLSQQIAGLQSTSGNLQTQQASNLELVRLGDMATKTATLVGHGLSEQKVSESLDISGQGESNVVAVSSTMSSPVLAAEVVNVYTHQFVVEQARANRSYFKSALALVRRQLNELTPAQRVGQDGLSLQQRAQTLRLLTDLNFGNVQVAQQATVPTAPSSPRTSRDTLLGALLGLLIGLGFAFVFERFDRHIKTSEDLERIYQLPLLGVVPESDAVSRSADQNSRVQAMLPPAEAEAFHMIRGHLRFFNVDRELCTILVASPSPGDGKTTIARHLAEAAARMGSRTLLLEADFRHPTLARRLAIAPEPGLAHVLTGALRVEEATQMIDLEAPSGEGAPGRTLDVLVAGVVPPNPGELIESYAMAAVLVRVKSVYDLVIIDTAPLLAVSDAFPLLDKVDGVVVVGRIGHSRSDVAERLHRVLASSSAPLLGVIANSAKSSGPASYGYPVARPLPPAAGDPPQAEAVRPGTSV